MLARTLNRAHHTGVHIATEYRIVGTPVGRPAVKLLAGSRQAANYGIPVFRTGIRGHEGATKLTIYRTREMSANPLPEPEPKPKSRKPRRKKSDKGGQWTTKNPTGRTVGQCISQAVPPCLRATGWHDRGHARRQILVIVKAA